MIQDSFLKSFRETKSPFITNPYRFAGAAAVGGWVELGRTTLGSAGDNITVSSLPDKRYYMVLAHTLASTSSQSQVQMGNTTIDTGSNYSGRWSNSGGADGTQVSQSDISISDTNSTTAFEMGYISNLSGKEKLGQFWNILQNTAGSSTSPSRTESVGKWANTSNPLDIVNWFNRNANSYNTNSELVVLGWDPADTHTSNFWEELASVDLSGGAADTLDSGTFSAKKYLWVQTYIKAVSGTVEPDSQFNSDTGSNYADRYNINGGSDGTGTSLTTGVRGSGVPYSAFFNDFIINNASNEKLVIRHVIYPPASGAASAPSRRETVGKWANTSSQITSIQWKENSGGAGQFDTGSIIKVFGSD